MGCAPTIQWTPRVFTCNAQSGFRAEERRLRDNLGGGQRRPANPSFLVLPSLTLWGRSMVLRELRCIWDPPLAEVQIAAHGTAVQ